MALSPLMPKATAVWLVDNTSLTFDQIADFCSLHELEVKGIADGDVAQGIRGMDPVTSGQLTRDEIERGQANSSYRLKIAESKVEIPEVKTKRGPRYTPVSRRQDRPDAISWLLRHHAELTDGQVIKLVGTTKPTIQSIRDRSHWNTPNIQPKDPVTLGLCSQSDLDGAVQKAADKLERERAKLESEARKAGTLLPTAETVTEPVVEDTSGFATLIVAGAKAEEPAEEMTEQARAFPDQPGATPSEDDDGEQTYDADSVFAKLKDLAIDADETSEEAGDEQEASGETSDEAGEVQEVSEEASDES
jgi:hypothetical protein